MQVSSLAYCGDGGIPVGNYDVVPATDDQGYAGSGQSLYGWSLQNTFAGLSTVYIRFGTSAAATPFIAVNLAENETITQMFPEGIPGGESGFFFTVEAGTVAGVLYTT